MCTVGAIHESPAFAEAKCASNCRDRRPRLSVWFANFAERKGERRREINPRPTGASGVPSKKGKPPSHPLPRELSRRASLVCGQFLPRGKGSAVMVLLRKSYDMIASYY